MIGAVVLAIVTAVAPSDSTIHARAGVSGAAAPRGRTSCPAVANLHDAPIEPDPSERPSPQDGQAGRRLHFTGHFAFRWTRMYEDGSRFAGGGLGVLVGERTRLELVGLGTAEPSRYSTLDFRLAYGGVQADHELLRRGPWTAGAAGTIAAGSFAVKDRQADTEERTGVWVAEPELYVGAHVGPHLRLTAGASYRWVTGIEGEILNRSDGDARGGAIVLRLTAR